MHERQIHNIWLNTQVIVPIFINSATIEIISMFSYSVSCQHLTWSLYFVRQEEREKKIQNKRRYIQNVKEMIEECDSDG